MNPGKNNLLIAFVAIAALMVLGMLAINEWEPETNIIPVKTTGTIGVIEVKGVIETTGYTDILSEAVQEAMSDSSIDAVVLQIDSPGGSADLVEQVYHDLRALNEDKPLVASCTMALSGGYYLAVASDYIFTVPSGMVGNVGVIGSGPGFLVPSEFRFETGPQKITGFSTLMFPFNITKALDSFAAAVEEGRSGKLDITMTRVKAGGVYLGREAVNLGLADEIGSHQEAISYAAELAGVDSYSVENLMPSFGNNTIWFETAFPSVRELNELQPPPALHYLYMPGDIYMESEVEEDGDTRLVNLTGTHKGDVVVDMSHGNRFSPFIMDYVQGELASHGVTVAYSQTWDNIEDVIDEASCLLIANPTEFYNSEEVSMVKEWLSKGNMLVLVGDGGAEFIDATVMHGPLNSFSDPFGVHFREGYLYNLRDNYGFYRNINIDRLDQCWLTEGVEEAVFFTTCHVAHTGGDAAYTSYGTMNSVTERTGVYAAAVVKEEMNGTLVAFGDTTWMMEPWVGVADNMRLADNLIEEIADQAK